MKWKIYSLLLIIILLANNTVAKSHNYPYYEENDPFVAGLLSATMMGLGQFYAKEYTKGSIFVLTDFIQKGTLIWMIVSLNEKYTNEDIDDQVVEWQELTDNDKALIVGYLVFYFGSRIFCIIDAVHSANLYNENIKNQRVNNNTGFNFVFNSNKNNISACYFRRF